ncbi:MAG: peptidylprolyl isomerase [Bacteroidetes bacterium]|nr:MAG: peptidylprolyl isomerase [Bacteroidota bacterium]REK00042.1 MAG: peptidylprolyl isomerase [Bacteroidota bacterium]REK35777.1 MAG: peptidylprolyl isomerase [Bacteroidota bacterium]REK49350.1 MAG: peptidylprolyl isomerase [Bacteroidota bacterium]
MKISANKVVTVSYELHANAPGENRNHIETADKSEPLKFLFGIGMMIPGFERGLEGKGTGDKFDFSIEAEEGYGDVEETAVIQLPIEIFKVDNAIDFSMLKVGNVLPMNDQEGNVLNGKVLKYDETMVTMDFNHPLAGHQLHFSGEVLEVRDASPEEINHGHVH